MDTARWERIQSLYLAALDADPEGRDALLASADVDADLRREVLEMLAVTSDEVELRVEEKLLGGDDTISWSDERLLSSTIGRYRVVERLGRGGMGDVFRARRDDDDIEHEVAIKLLRTSALSPETVARFRAEQSILARLTHPAIVGLIDTGMTDEGQPFFVMPIVRGTPLTEWCDSRNASISSRLELFRQVCDAVHYAHRNLVIHRDLKPSNVLVTEDGIVQLLDFGIAKLMDPEAAGEPLTQTGNVMMTPEYASPEQVRGEPPTTAVDVYALGVMLYEILSGVRPHRSATGSRAELERAICESSPPRLTESVDEAIAAARSTTRRELDRRLGGDLQTIVTKALHKEPDRRYGSAADLAEDLHRWQRALPISARPDTWTYRARTFVRRNRAASIAAGVVGLALVATAITFWTQSRRAAAERDRLIGVVDVLTDVFETVDPIATPGIDTLSVGDFLAENEERILAALSGDPVLESALAATFGALHHTRERWERADALFLRAYERRNDVLGERHPSTVAALQDLARLRLRTNTADAESLVRRSLALLREVTTEPTPELATAVSDLALITTSWPEQRALLSEMIDIRSVVCGDDPICHALGYNALATACFTRDSLEAAATHFQTALDHLQRAVPADHPHALTVTQNLASSLSASGQPARAESLFVWIIQRERERLGDRTSRVGVNLNNLGLTQLVQGRHREALATLEQALEVQREVFGDVHPRVANTAYNLFRLHLMREDTSAARAFLDATLTACGSEDADARKRYKIFIAALDLAIGREAPARDALLAWRAEHGDEEDTRMSMNIRFLLAQALIATGDVGEARRELEHMRGYYGTRGAHRQAMLAAVDGGLGLCLAELGRTEEATPLVERALEVYGAHGAADTAFIRRLEEFLTVNGRASR